MSGGGGGVVGPEVDRRGERGGGRFVVNLLGSRTNPNLSFTPRYSLSAGRLDDSRSDGPVVCGRSVVETECQ